MKSEIKNHRSEISSGGFVRGLGKFVASLLYRVTPFGQHWLPPGGFLLLPNHLTWVDAVVLQLACPRPIRFVVDAAIYKIAWLNPIFRAVGALPISPKRAKDAVRDAAAAIEAGEIVCIFPEGELSRTGMLLRLKRGYELIARAANCPVVPVWLDRLWGSIFSFVEGKYFLNGRAGCRIRLRWPLGNRSRRTRRTSQRCASASLRSASSATSSGLTSKGISPGPACAG